MPTLNWIGKEAVVKHHKEVPYRLLEPVAELPCSPRPQAGEGQGERVSGNLIDESGDEGFTFLPNEQGSSRWLVFSALVIHKARKECA